MEAEMANDGPQRPGETEKQYVDRISRSLGMTPKQANREVRDMIRKRSQ